MTSKHKFGTHMEEDPSASQPAPKKKKIDKGTHMEEDPSASQPAPKKKKIDKGKKNYMKTAEQKGLMLILNFSRDREGSDQDVVKLRQLFEESYKFEVEQYQDLKKDELLLQLKDYREQYMKDPMQSENYYCFICVIMGHGNEYGIQTDDKLVPMDEITQIFKNKETQEFLGKPKIFIVQACRGPGTQEIVRADETTPPIEDCVGKLSRPQDADILIAYATTPGYKAYRSISHIGAWFIHVLLQVIKESDENDHFEEMLTMVRYRMALDEEWRKHGNCQMPCSYTTLTKSLYFRQSVA